MFCFGFSDIWWGMFLFPMLWLNGHMGLTRLDILMLLPVVLVHLVTNLYCPRYGAIPKLDLLDLPWCWDSLCLLLIQTLPMYIFFSKILGISFHFSLNCSAKSSAELPLALTSSIFNLYLLIVLVWLYFFSFSIFIHSLCHFA